MPSPRNAAAGGRSWTNGPLDAQRVVDSTIVAQAPKMAPHIQAMRQRLATALGIQLDQVNVKAKTAEKMGPVGRYESIETRAVCLLFKP